MIVAVQCAYAPQFFNVPYIFRIKPWPYPVHCLSKIFRSKCGWKGKSEIYLLPCARINVQVMVPSQVNPCFKKAPAPECYVFLQQNVCKIKIATDSVDKRTRSAADSLFASAVGMVGR